MKLNTNTISIVIAIIVLIGGGYWYISSSGTGNEPPLTSGVETNVAQIKFQTLVQKLQPIKFDTSIFSNPRFNALVDIATPVTPEPYGRLDPFAPVSGVIN